MKEIENDILLLKLTFISHVHRFFGRVLTPDIVSVHGSKRSFFVVAMVPYVNEFGKKLMFVYSSVYNRKFEFEDIQCHVSFQKYVSPLKIKRK